VKKGQSRPGESIRCDQIIPLTTYHTLCRTLLPRYTVPVRAIFAMDAARRSIKELNAAIGEDAFEYLIGWVRVLNDDHFNNTVNEGIQFEEVLVDVQRTIGELGAVPHMPFQYAKSAMEELKEYEVTLRTVVGWVKDIKQSIEYGTLKDRFAAEALDVQQERCKRS
jgi:hypothetical protein